MTPRRLILVQMSSATRPVARDAARRAFPDADVVEVGSLKEASLFGEAHHPMLLVMAEPAPASIAEAVQAVDDAGRPRWAVVILGRDSSDVAETVPSEEWNAPLIARAFRSAFLQFELGNENLRLQGDLKTVARRVTHDLYSPIGCIYGCLNVMKEVLPPNDVSPGAVMVRNIEESSLEITQILDRVSFMLRASADAIPPVPCEIAGVVADVLAQLEPDLEKAGAAVVQPASWPEVIGVQRWLHVIWWNLLDNAIKHGGPAAQIRIDWTQEDCGHRFSVADRGPGVPSKIQAGLFRRFDELHAFHSPGLGLSIVQRLVSLQGGRCGYERLGDEWSLFYFTLPAGSHGVPLHHGCALLEHPALPAATPTTGALDAAAPREIGVTCSPEVGGD